ncbi:Dyp-type peroxidase [Streptomyces xanthochromogenes]|uniref:Dyp-type peroxidase n=1 Tax=Streptomyces xanthochromogenes TaxID=67384 RepID=UPI003800F5FB
MADALKNRRVQAQNRIDNHRSITQNPFHFTEGFGNPNSDSDITDRAIVRPSPGQPPWATGGSYQVVRIVRLATELWDRDSITEQEQVIGRRRDGRWLDGAPAEEDPDFVPDPQGRVTPLDSHVRLVTPDRASPPPIVRRSYSYNRGSEDAGLIFSCFQRDLKAGFEAAQRRLEGEAMAKYILTKGGGYFFASAGRRVDSGRIRRLTLAALRDRRARCHTALPRGEGQRPHEAAHRGGGASLPGPSPSARGAAFESPQVGVVDGAIPARARSRMGLCREQFLASLAGPPCSGPSPRVRGTGSATCDSTDR